MCPGGESGTEAKAGRVRYWQYGLAGNSPNLAKRPASRFPRAGRCRANPPHLPYQAGLAASGATPAGRAGRMTLP